MFTPARYHRGFDFEDLFNDFAFPAFDTNPMKNFPEMKTDVKEMENGFELAIDIPGYRKENVKAQLKNGYLTVTAEKNDEKETKSEEGKFIRRERYSGSMSRSYYVGEQVSEEDIKANFADGTLRLFVPKETRQEVPQEKFIAIEG